MGEPLPASVDHGLPSKAKLEAIVSSVPVDSSFKEGLMSPGNAEDDPAPQLQDVRKELHRLNEGVDAIATIIKEYMSKTPAPSDDYEKNDEKDNMKDDGKDNKSQSSDDTSVVQGDGEEDTGAEQLKHVDSFKTTYLTVPALGQKKPLIPEARKCTWEQFKNRFSKDEDIYTIDYLVVGTNLEQEKSEESKKRKKYSGVNPKAKVDQKSNSNELLSHTNETLPRCVRIQSRHVREALSRINEKVSLGRFPEESLSFKAPFRLFILSQFQMKEELTKMETELNSLEKELPTVDTTSGNSPCDAPPRSGIEEIDRSDAPPVSIEERRVRATDLSAMEQPRSPVEKLENDERPESVPLRDDQYNTVDSKREAVEQMRCYVNFVDQKIIPEMAKFDKIELNEKQTIRFDELWYLFRLGALIYAPKKGDADSSPLTSSQPTICRIYDIFLPGDIKAGVHCDCDVCAKPLEDFTVKAYCLDYDGTSYGPITKEFPIKKYEDRRSINKLPFYPLTNCGSSSEVLERAREEGKKFKYFAEKRRGWYSGWTLISDPRGDMKPDNQDLQGAGDGSDDTSGRASENPEHIESDVIIDFKETFSNKVSWRPHFDPQWATEIYESKFEYKEDIDNHHITWSDAYRSERLQDCKECVVRSDGLALIQHNKSIQNDPYLTQKDGPPTEPYGDDLALLPRRIAAYALWERKFVRIDVQSLQEFSASSGSDPFNKLEIPRSHKDMIQALLAAHFAQKDIEKEVGPVKSQDLIRGKGKGVIILLHGVPGVGKTATAEAVAQSWGQPLFPITCGDLGATASSVEKSLNDIFRLAHLWDCVLLLDEADVFITERSDEDLQRNALVSVFLRMLEYYNGILFLTTNREGKLDEAVKSRVKLSLRYNALTKEQTIAIFKLNIEKLKEIEAQRMEATNHESKPLRIGEDEIMDFAQHHYQDNHPDKRWNGRQIRNAFSIASSLAHYDYKTNPKGGLALQKAHFEKVQEATVLYEKYREAARGASDRVIAKEHLYRDDDFNPTMEGLRRATERRSSAVALAPNSPYNQQSQYHAWGPQAQGQLHSESALHIDPSRYGHVVPGLQQPAYGYYAQNNMSLQGQVRTAPGQSQVANYDAPQVGQCAIQQGRGMPAFNQQLTEQSVSNNPLFANIQNPGMQRNYSPAPCPPSTSQSNTMSPQYSAFPSNTPNNLPSNGGNYGSNQQNAYISPA